MVIRSNDPLRPFWSADLSVERKVERLAARQREIRDTFAHTRRVNLLIEIGYPDPEFSIALGYCWRCDALPKGFRDGPVSCCCGED